ncbi:ATP-binding protein [Dethiosulfatarculus sandiegensis]|uniref:histidine kinase n=1 Tax=Dethiosulfatarculus sandiegensis TaxID=1429043 RepID=A0A0D2JD06_9BACT|nr:ATP-binding protein [Dethiosulfatarculus sandiegensis]KIX16069.1 hypothetical protein X474_00895 [Dethiosulfatarculus sandiegensis]
MTAEIPYRILIVDDEKRLRDACRRVLEPQGFIITDAEDGLDGLKAIEKDQPDLALVDLMMPNMGGMEMLAEARKKHPNMAFVVITGYATLDKAVEAMKQGADDFLAKPFKPQDLRLVVEKVLKRVRTLKDMALEKSRNRVLVDSLTNGVLLVDKEGLIAVMNPALRRLSTWQGDDPQGLRPDQVLDCPEVNRALDAVLSGEEIDSDGITCTISLNNQGPPTHLQVTCAPFRDGRGVLLGAMAIFEDVTAWISLDQLKNEYVSTVAHEIASPLSSVLSQLQTLQRGLAGELNEKQTHLIDRAAARVGGIVKLSKELLDLAKIEAGAMGEKEEISLGELISEAVDIVSVKADEKEQKLKAEIPPDLPSVLGIRPAVLEVFINLLSNAVRYTPEKGDISVTARALESGVETAVKDNGFGIPPEDHEKIFERFYRVKDANTRMIVGTGLGLPIVKKVVREHGGNIKLESAPGEGSTFYVFLPFT